MPSYQRSPGRVLGFSIAFYLSFCLIITSPGFSQSPGDVLINEIVTDPQRDYSSGAFDGSSPGVIVNSNDEWIELYIVQSNLDLTGWTLFLQDGTPFSGDLTSRNNTGTGAFQTIVYSGIGSFENTAAGDYLVLGNPQSDEEMSNSLTIVLRDPSNVIIDQVEIESISGTGFNGYANEDLNYESISRIPNGWDTDVDHLDFVKTRASIGASNSPTGTVWINEIVTDPQQDWSFVDFSIPNPGGSAGENDEWIELLIQTAGLNLTKWTISLDDTSPRHGDLTDTSAFQSSIYIGTGSFNNTEAGDLLILGNPSGSIEALNNDIHIVISDAYGNVVDDVELGDFGIPGEGAPSGASDDIMTESVFRIPFAPDTDNDAVDFQKGPSSLGSTFGVIYVDANALDDSGSGIMTDPKQSLQSAIDLAPHRGMLLMSSGTYSESVVFSDDLFIIPEIGSNVADVEIDGGNLHILINSFHIDNSITLTSGIFDLDQDDGDKTDDPVFILPPLLLGSSFNSNTHFEGRILSEVTGASSFTFPVGDEGAYRPVTLQPTSTATFEVSYRLEATPGDILFDLVGNPASQMGGNTIESVLDYRYWQIDVTANSPGNTNVTLEVAAADGVSNPGTLGMARFNGTSWEEMTRQSGSGSGPYVLIATTDTFSPISVYSTNSTENPLPVELIHFNGIRSGQNIKLEWATASEINSDYFQVEHSIDGVEFSGIGTVRSNGNTNQRMDYQFTDVNVRDQPNYYRLKMVDFDGSFEYSNSILVSPDFSEARLLLYPNPTADRLQIEGVLPQFIADIKLYNLSGQLVMSVSPEDQLTISLADLPMGYYLIKVALADGSTFEGKLLKE